jgi:oligopeptide/dipeptide ABC transporter ATP-binding protein
MYLGRLVEKAPSEELFEAPLHPYTEALLSAIPVARIHNRRERILLKGELTSPINPEPVCRFAARCNRCMDICTREEPPLIEARPNHFVACHLHQVRG